MHSRHFVSLQKKEINYGYRRDNYLKKKILKNVYEHTAKLEIFGRRQTNEL